MNVKKVQEAQAVPGIESTYLVPFSFQGFQIVESTINRWIRAFKAHIYMKGCEVLTW